MATAKFLDIQVLNYAIKSLSKQIDKTFLKKSVLFDVTPAYYKMFDALTDDASKMLTVVDNNVTPSTGEIKSDDVRTVTKTPATVYAVGSQIIYIEEVLNPKYDNVIGISDADLTVIKNDTSQSRQNQYKGNILFVVDDNKLVFYDRDLDTFTDCSTGTSDGAIGYDFTSNIDVGAYPKGTSFTKEMLIKDIVKGIFIAYLQPNVTFTPVKDQTFEIGYNYTGEELKAVITKQSNDIVSVKFYEDSNELYSDTSTATMGGTVTYQYSTTNNDTDIKLKCIVDDGQSPVTVERKVSFVRKGFYGTSTSSNVAVTTSAEVRALSNSVLAPKSGSAFTINIPTGATLVTIAVPSDRTLKSVIYVEGMNSEVKDTFALSTVNVEGANGYSGIDYNVYSYVPSIPFPTNSTYKVTLG